jgi:excisionase family DNA binding protein
MDYVSTRETAENWGVSLRYVQRLIEDGRIAGARKYGVSWLIPKDAKKPADPRRARTRPAGAAPAWILLTPTPLLKRNPDAAASAYPSRYRPLLAADVAYRRGDPTPAMDVWRSTPERDPAKLTAAAVATVAAISAGDFDLYDEIQRTVHARMARTRDRRERALLSLPETLAAVSMAAARMTPQWLRDGDFSLFPREQIPLLLYLYTLHLRNINDSSAVLHTAKASYELCVQTHTFTWLDVYNLTLCAQASFDLGDKARAREYLTSAMRLGLPAGMIAPFADYLGTLGGLTEACLDAYYPQYKAPVTALWSRSFRNWMTFHNRFTSENITTILTPQEYQLARYLAHGASYAEAAEQMHLSVGRVKNILLDVYGKLYIKKRSQLAPFLT